MIGMLGWILGWKLIQQPTSWWESVRELQWIFGSNSSQPVHYPALAYWQWGFHPKQEAAGRTQLLNGTRGAPWCNLIILKLTKLLVILLSKVIPGLASLLLPACLSCARKGPVRSTAFISYWVFLESWVTFWFSLREHSREELQEYLSLSSEWVWPRQTGVIHLTAMMKDFLIVLLSLLSAVSSGMGLIWAKAPEYHKYPSFPFSFFSCSSGSPWLRIFHILQN